MHTYLTTHMHTNTDGPVVALYMKQDSELSAVQSSDKVQCLTVKHQWVTDWQRALIIQIKPFSEIPFQSFIVN